MGVKRPFYLVKNLVFIYRYLQNVYDIKNKIEVSCYMNMLI